MRTAGDLIDMKRDPTPFDYGLTLAFAGVAAAASMLAAFSGARIHSRVDHQKGAVAKQETRAAAYRMYAIGGVLALPAFWYGGVALRGLCGSTRD